MRRNEKAAKTEHAK